MSDPKRSLDIEAALRWAFRDELPKVAALDREELDAPRRSDAFGRRGEAETAVQMMIGMPANCFGVVKAVGSRGSAHPDAILIGDAVQALNGMVLGVPEDWRPLAEMDGLSPEVTRLIEVATERVAGTIEGGRRLFGMTPSVVVQRRALSGDVPDWRAEVPTVKLVASPNGVPKWFVTRLRWSKAVDGRDVSHEVEEDGFNVRSRRPYGDAYRKVFLEPDPTPAIRARAEYELWHAALDALAADLAPRLTTIRLSPTRRPARPWLDGGDAPSVVPSLDDMGPLVRLPPRRATTASPGRRPSSAPRKAPPAACTAR